MRISSGSSSESEVKDSTSDSSESEVESYSGGTYSGQHEFIHETSTLTLDIKTGPIPS